MSSKKLCPRGCGNQCDYQAKQCIACREGVTAFNKATAPAVAPPEALVKADRDRRKLADELATLKRKYDGAQAIIESQERELEAHAALTDSLDTFTITPSQPKGTSEATAVLVASDWHVSERVGPELGGLNTHNLDIAKQRAIKFFQKGLRLTNLLAKDIKIPTILLALLGDFITGDIHGADNAETNDVTPMHEVAAAQSFIVSGIDFILANSDYKLVIPCHSGNHARTTQKTRFANENGHSLEFLMYLHLRDYYRSEDRVEVIVPPGYHSYVQVYDRTLRLHHGHAIKYGGGVGGIFIPTFKKIANWNRGRQASLDIFGHFHTQVDGGNFLANGSNIGFNAYALNIGAPFDVPKQTLFLEDKRRGRTFTLPILTGESQ